MKKLYLFAVIAILVIGVSIVAGMAADVIQKPSSTGHSGASQLSAQAFRHKQWVWTPGVATQVNWPRDSPLLNVATTGAEKNYCRLVLNPSANDVEVSIPLTLTGGKKYVRNVMLCSTGSTNDARVDKLDIYDGDLYLASASGAGKYFNGVQENSFDLGAYYAIDRGLTVVLYIDNLDSINAQVFWIDAVGAETRW